MSVKWLQKFLGHSSLQTTMRYLHLTEDAARDGRETLNQLTQPGDLFSDLRPERQGD